MKTDTFKGTIGNAFGQKISPVLSFDGTFEAYENYDEVPEKEKLTPKDMLAVVNDARKANERAKVMAEVLKNAGYEKPEADAPQVVLKGMIKNLLLLKKDGVPVHNQASATALAETLVGYSLETV